MNPLIQKRMLENPWLLQLPTEARQELIAVAQIKQYKAGQRIHSKGQPGDGLIGVLEGQVRASATTFNGDELVFTSINSDEWFGEICILDNDMRTHDAHTLKDSVLAILPTKSVLAISKQHSAVYQALVQLLCQHCRQAFSAIDDFLLYSPEQRLAKRLVAYASKRSSIYTVHLNQQDLGKLVGISRQSTNKILKSWEQQGWVKRDYGGLQVLSAIDLSSVYSA